MSKSIKTQRLREKMRAAVKQSKQATLDNLPETPKKAAKAAVPEQKKQIEITEIGSVTKEDELALKIGFKLSPSKLSFSKVNADLFFDGRVLSAVRISVPQSPLARDDFEFSSVLDMRGIAAGAHVIKIEMYELWNSGQKLNCATKEVAVDYVPVSREDKLIEIPIVKSVVGANLEVVSDSEKDVYREIEESMKKESASK